MRELTEEEALTVSGGVREAAPLASVNQPGPHSSALSVDTLFANQLQIMPPLDIQVEIDSIIMES